MAKTTTNTASIEAANEAAQNYRVYAMPGLLRADYKASREVKGMTNEQLVTFAITENLQGIVRTLQQLGFQRTSGDNRPARLPISEGLLEALATASAKVNLPQSQLLMLCLAASCESTATETAPKTTKKASKVNTTEKKGRAAKAVRVAKKATKKAKK